MAQLKCTHCGFINAPQKNSCVKCGTPLPRVRVRSGDSRASNGSQFRRGQIIATRYTVLDLIGRGGMACIYKVQDNTLKEAVALKTMLPEFTRDKALVDRFYNEAKIARQLTHPNIVRVHDIGMAEGVLYISMELLEGRSLRGVLDGLQAGQRLPVKTALRIVDQLCAALEYAHNYTIHRDLKPENVMVLNDGTVKLMDFGISKLRADSSLTATSMVMGTPHYMSPEQLKDSRNVDARTDVYSMGVLLYEIMTGNIPTGVPKPASQIMKETPPDIDRIIQTCMEPDPISRYQSIHELRAAIRAILDLVESNTTAQPFGGSKPKRKAKNTALPKQLVGILAVLLIAAATSAVVWQLDGRRQALLAAEPAAATRSIAVDPVQAEFSALMDWTRRAEPLAVDAAGDDDDKLGLLTSAQQHAEAAKASGSVESARKALACYLGLIACPEGALFVPPGTVELDGADIEIDPFFIAQGHVTNGAFAEFTENVEDWGAYRYTGGYDDPATWVTFYDAQMYAAYVGLRLPTYAEWVRAFDVDPDAMASPIADWTQTRVGGPANASGVDELDQLRFGTSLVTIQAVERDDGPVIDTLPWPYEHGNEIVGIRLAWPVPLDKVNVEAALNGT